MKKSTLMLGLLILLTGCIPLQQSKTTGTRKFECLSADEGYFMEQLGPSDQAKQKKIIASESYVISPKNIRYAVELQPHDYDLSEHFPYIRDRIYLLNDKGRRISSFGNGTWSLFLMIASKDGKELRQFKANIWTYYYNPILHGPPN